MEHYLKGNLQKVVRMEKVFFDGQTDNIMMEISKMRNLMVMESIIGLMANPIKVTGWMEK